MSISKFNEIRIIEVLFYAFVFFLPLLEAPKNIFSVLFVFFGTIELLKEKNLIPFKGRRFYTSSKNYEDRECIVFALLFLCLSALIGGLGETQLRFYDIGNALNWMIMPITAILLLAKTAVWNSDKILLRTCRVLNASTFVAILEAFYRWEAGDIELRSVGHVNQSALYLCFAMVSLIYPVIQHRPSLIDFALLCVVSPLILLFLLYSNSFTALAGFGVVMVTYYLAFAWQGRLKAIVLFGLPMVAVALCMLFVATPSDYLGPFESLKHEMNYKLSSSDRIWSERDRLLYTAWFAAKDSFLGFGVKSFGSIAHPDFLSEIAAARSVDFDGVRHKLFFTTHGHNLFVNTLVEKGWIGILSILLFIASSLNAIFKSSNSSLPERQSAFVVLALVIVCGLGQTTLANEHGYMALILLALFVQKFTTFAGKS